MKKIIVFIIGSLFCISSSSINCLNRDKFVLPLFEKEIKYDARLVRLDTINSDYRINWSGGDTPDLFKLYFREFSNERKVKPIDKIHFIKENLLDRDSLTYDYIYGRKGVKGYNLYLYSREVREMDSKTKSPNYIRGFLLFENNNKIKYSMAVYVENKIYVGYKLDTYIFDNYVVVVKIEGQCYDVAIDSIEIIEKGYDYCKDLYSYGVLKINSDGSFKTLSEAEAEVMIRKKFRR
ncbi:hypothetical protein [Flavobacterium sp. '19STA2R22 D10 B1']|uniref:hypothetical protein n=1 Tax=Flavobacterium aerium TaxID=3037261 RepID=UPI00278C27A6|nr:hypothetical protein [Flavobacterium sp. '19STA2R22 D10 B1']